MDQPDLGPLARRPGRSHLLVRYGERGCGLSNWEVADAGFDAWVNYLEAVVDGTGLDRFPLLGMSQGGAVAIAYAVRHPERISRLVLADAYCRGRLGRATTVDEREEAALDLHRERGALPRRLREHRRLRQATKVRCPTLILHSRDDLRVPERRHRNSPPSSPAASCASWPAATTY